MSHYGVFRDGVLIQHGAIDADGYFHPPAHLEQGDQLKAPITGDLIDPVDIIGPGEIRHLAGGVTRATMKHWREGRNTRGAGTFPQPFKTVSGVELYDRRAVLAWLEEHRPA
jgi:hypothetical protein